MTDNSERAVDVRRIGTLAEQPLRLGGCDAGLLAAAYGTPLLVIDEDSLRATMRRFRAAFARAGWLTTVAYAGKALLVKTLARLADEEGLALDVCSAGELQTALAAGVEPARCVMHGCYKTEEELDLAVSQRVGFVVVDHRGEIEALSARADALGVTCRVLVRVNPGIAAQTHGRIQTGGPGAKFGFPIADGQALDAAVAIASQPGLELAGVHCHLGSQIYDLTLYQREVEALVDFAERAKRACRAAFEVLNLGGGLGISEGERAAPPPEAWASMILDTLDRRLASSALPRPHVFVEPGRALVGPAGTTLYRIGVRKQLAGGARALIVDGGMSDNPRPALYQARYGVTLADRPDAPADGTYTVFGRHCETDELFVDVPLPDPQPGDLLAVRNTGAYTYSMASNYNRFGRPAVVLAGSGAHRLIATREPLDHVLDLDVWD